jgi:hypothetical protein
VFYEAPWENHGCRSLLLLASATPAAASSTVTVSMFVQLLLPNPHMMMEMMGGCDHYHKQGKFLPTRQSHRGKTV